MPSSLASRLRSAAHRHPHRTDLAVAVVVLLLTVTGLLLPPAVPGARTCVPAVLACLAVCFAGVALRSWFPQALTLLLAVAYAVLVLTTRAQVPGVLLTQGCLTYTLALRTARPTALLTAATAGLLMYLADALARVGIFWHPDNLAIALAGVLGAALGDATRSRRAYIAEIEERMRRAERSREEEAQRRVVQERLRIARELHDVVAHHIAVISVQAGAVSHLLNRRPDRIAPAIGHIREACDTVLTELSSIVGVLRQPGDPSSTEPAPGPRRLPDLLESMAAAGLRVDYRRTGTERALPALTDLAAHRVIQEALTNAHRYGTGSADLTVRYGLRDIEIVVSNPLGDTGKDAARSGYGLLGMSERVTAAAGALRTGCTGDDCFVVRATMPAPPAACPAATADAPATEGAVTGGSVSGGSVGGGRVTDPPGADGRVGDGPVQVGRS